MAVRSRQPQPNTPQMAPRAAQASNNSGRRERMLDTAFNATTGTGRMWLRIRRSCTASNIGSTMAAKNRIKALDHSQRGLSSSATKRRTKRTQSKKSAGGTAASNQSRSPQPDVADAASSRLAKRASQVPSLPQTHHAQTGQRHGQEFEQPHGTVGLPLDQQQVMSLNRDDGADRSDDSGSQDRQQQRCRITGAPAHANKQNDNRRRDAQPIFGRQR